MYEIRRLKGAIKNRPMGLAELRAIMADRVGDLDELTGLPVECRTLREVATQIVLPRDRILIDEDIDELEASLTERIDAEGIARKGDYVVRPLAGLFNSSAKLRMARSS